MKVLSKKILKAVKESKETRIRLGYEFNRVQKTIDNWIDANSPMLTTPTALIVIREELNIDDNEPILEEV
jgi:hypothetical protein